MCTFLCYTLFMKDKIYYNLKKLRTGSLLRDDYDYYFVLGFLSDILESNTAIAVIHLEKKPKSLSDIADRLKGNDVFHHIIYFHVFGHPMVNPPKAVDYNYFSEEDSKLFLMKFNMLDSEYRYFYNVCANFTSSKRTKENCFYYDFLDEIGLDYCSLYQRLGTNLVSVTDKTKKYSIKDESVRLIELSKEEVERYV